MNEGLPASVRLLQLTATLYIVGLIWFLQIGHYSLLANVGVDEFSSYVDVAELP
ncbi:hypothetical protein Pla8534_36360 [Lignipirellula cremea]|uniref:Uncharacterized protein n=1 Tax=Lignipirellula cremea TaxID=2528010 RepID=A0A518DVF7_9BACT|nr:hypothetical protein Pla8534_36360 [Lignipirellula cremea]